MLAYGKFGCIYKHALYWQQVALATQWHHFPPSDLDFALSLLYFILLFWNQTLTCLSDRFNSFASFILFKPTTYISTENSSSSRSNCAGVNDVLLLLGFGLGRLDRGCEWTGLGPNNNEQINSINTFLLHTCTFTFLLSCYLASPVKEFLVKIVMCVTWYHNSIGIWPFWYLRLKKSRSWKTQQYHFYLIEQRRLAPIRE